MSPKLAAPLFAFVLFHACQTEPMRPDAQNIIDRLAKEQSDIVRLTLHTTPPDGGAMCAVASTASDKLGKPSDPEDVKAMQTGETVVLEEGGSLDVTVPIQQFEGRWTAAVGVTLRPAAGEVRWQTVARATEIAKAVEAGLTRGW
jgi:hypothetical protein